MNGDARNKKKMRLFEFTIYCNDPIPSELQQKFLELYCIGAFGSNSDVVGCFENYCYRRRLMGKKHKNRKEYYDKQHNELENNSIEKLSNEAVSFTAGEMFASSQVDARAGKETYAEEAEEGLSETAGEMFASSNVDASMKKALK